MKKQIYEQSEHQIQTSILNILSYYGVFAWRNNSGMIAVGEGKYRRMIKLGVAGMPDILGIQKESGRLVGIEVKKPGKTTTEAQKHMLETLEEYGAIVYVAHSVDDIAQLFGKRK
jgi:hypothetical protein